MKKKRPETAATRHAPNFETLQRAFADGAVCLMECQRVETGESVAAVCTVHRDEAGDYCMTPFAVMIDGNPFELFRPPDPDGGFHPLEAEEVTP